MPNYELLKPVSIKLLEDAGACESELHRFTFLALKEYQKSGWSLGYSTSCLDIGDIVRLASQCTGMIEFLLKHDFIRPKEPELLPCPFCGSKDVGWTKFERYHLISCNQCYAKSQWTLSKDDPITVKQVIKAWNNRV